MDRQQIRLGLIGYGEIGSTLGRGLRDEGLGEIASYDKYAFNGPFAELIQSRAAAAHVPLVRSPQELAARSDLLLGVTPGSASVESADAFAPHLTSDHLFVDLASATPNVKRSVGRIFGGSGAGIGDASIMGTPHADGYCLPILSSGPAAQAFRDLMNPWGLKIECVDGGLGAASGIKILRSVVMKGLEALLVECVLGARRYGIDQAVLESLAKFMDGRPFQQTANFLLTTDVIHAARRAEEAQMSLEALQEAGVDGRMTQATADKLAWVAGLNAKSWLGGVVPQGYTTAIESIEKLLAETVKEFDEPPL
jgi:3-hydroxyisobutyrate dehydrogenase-like beta-hydroxyacid dehydrogenase